MCGIVGVFNSTNKFFIDKTRLEKMNNSQRHRGPDEGGMHIEPGIGLGHRRLSIIDLSSGQQPMCNEDGTVHIVYNGEIYNFTSLKRTLIKSGHIFKTHCDTEVIVHAWEEWGEECVKKFRGMFAFAIWDRNSESVFLARDRLGIKPLYYATTDNHEFIFSSEIKALISYGGISHDINPHAVEDYLAFGYIPAPKSIFKSINKLSPGHTLAVRRSAKHIFDVKAKEFWDVRFDDTSFRNTQFSENIAHELYERFEEAVKIRLVSDVPLGAFLSGGVDSSAVVAMMAENSSSPVKTCSIGFSDLNFDESKYARLVSSEFSTEHHEKTVAHNDFDLIDMLARIYDEPYADSSAIPTYRVCQLAREHVTVALSGDGGDETFAGYRRYRWHMREQRVRAMFPDSIRKSVFGFLGNHYPKLDWAPKYFRGKSTFQALGRTDVEGYFHNISVIPEQMRRALYSKSYISKLNGYNALQVFQHHAEKGPDDPVSLLQYIDMKTYLPEDILTKVDRASMANSLEVRVPILDHELVQWSACLPSGFKLNGNIGKWCFKKSLESKLPQNVLYRKKMGFAVPLSSWFRNELRDRVKQVTKSPYLHGSGIFDMIMVKKLIEQHQSGSHEHSAAIWSILMLESFLRNVCETVDIQPDSMSVNESMCAKFAT